MHVLILTVFIRGFNQKSNTAKRQRKTTYNIFKLVHGIKARGYNIFTIFYSIDLYTSIKMSYDFFVQISFHFLYFLVTCSLFGHKDLCLEMCLASFDKKRLKY